MPGSDERGHDKHRAYSALRVLVAPRKPLDQMSRYPDPRKQLGRLLHARRYKKPHASNIKLALEARGPKA